MRYLIEHLSIPMYSKSQGSLLNQAVLERLKLGLYGLTVQPVKAAFLVD
jgi:hypothetical protein